MSELSVSLTKAEMRLIERLVKAIGKLRAASRDVARLYVRAKEGVRTVPVDDALRACGFHANTIAKLNRMARALELVPDVDVWKALGWARVNRLTAATQDKRKVKAIVRDMMLQSTEQGVVVGADEKLSAALAKHKVTARPVTGGKKKAAGSVTPRPASAGDPADGLKILVQEIRRLVGAGYLGVNALSPAAAKVVGLGETKKRKRA